MSAALACSRALHAALVADDAAWSRLELVGHQLVEADGTEPAYTLELRNCSECHSTMARQVTQ